MGTAVLIQPDTSFIRSVIENGGGDLKKCYQCATCSAVCQLSPDDAPFPRKQMIEAQWGLKERLFGDAALWLCHNCGECSKMCPRGARPGDVFGALRRETIKHFAFPGFMGAMVANPKMWPLLFLLPVLVFAAIALSSTAIRGSGPLEFAQVFPIPALEALFFALSGFVLLSLTVSMARFTKALGAGGGPILQGLRPAFQLILTHERFAECESERARYWGHLLTLWGFIGLGVMGTAVGIGTMLGIMHTPLATLSPWKIFANLAALTAMVGIAILLAARVKDPVKRKASVWFDWFFLVTLAGVLVTGFASQILRLAEAASLMYPVYFIHLVLIFALFLYTPYSKFAHFLYRTVALASVAGAERIAESVVTAGAAVKQGST